MIRKLLCWLGWHEWIWKKKSWIVRLEYLGMETKIDPIGAWVITCKHCGRRKK